MVFGATAQTSPPHEARSEQAQAKKRHGGLGRADPAQGSPVVTRVAPATGAPTGVTGAAAGAAAGVTGVEPPVFDPDEAAVTT